MAHRTYKSPKLIENTCPVYCQYILWFVMSLLSCLALITGCVILFQFGESGIFALGSPLQIILIWLPFLKIIFGLRAISKF